MKDILRAKKVFDHLGMSVGIMPENIHERKQVKERSPIKILFVCNRVLSIAHSMLLGIVWPKPDERKHYLLKSMSASNDEMDSSVLDNARTPFVISDSNVKLNVMDWNI